MQRAFPGGSGAAIMTEQEWLKSTSPEELLDYMVKRASQRKFLLFACACERRLWEQPDCERDLVVAAERYADGKEHAALKAVLPTEGITLAEYITSAGPLEYAWDQSYYSAEYAANLITLKLTGERRCSRNEEIWGQALCAEQAEQTGLLRDIFGNPFRPVVQDPRWRTPEVVALARTIYEERRYQDMPVLADALEEAGCADPDILRHCREPGEHVRGCWVLDLVLGKE
jgi:hypothetical protein